MPIKYEDAVMLRFFHEDKGDLTICSEFTRNYDQLHEEYQVGYYLAAVEKANRDLDMLIQRIEDEAIDTELDYS